MLDNPCILSISILHRFTSGSIPILTEYSHQFRYVFLHLFGLCVHFLRGGCGFFHVDRVLLQGFVHFTHRSADLWDIQGLFIGGGRNFSYQAR